MRLIAVDDLHSENLGITTAVLWWGLSHEQLEKLEASINHPLSLSGARRLENYFGKNIGFVFPIEIGPQNSMVAMELASHLWVPFIDGDCAGRSVPEMQQTTLSVHNIPLAPFVISTFQGDSMMMFTSQSDERYEAICRAIAMASWGVINVSGFSFDGQTAKKVVIPGTISKCIQIGEIIQKKENIINNILLTTGGSLAFSGITKDFSIDNSKGFFEGHLTLEWVGDYARQEYKIWFRNEYLFSWKNGEKDISCPDLICVINSETGIGKVTYGQGFENEILPGEALTVFSVPAPEAWNNETGRQLFSPSHFGF